VTDVLLVGKICSLWLVLKNFVDQALLARDRPVEGDISARINAVPGIASQLRDSLHLFRQHRNSLVHTGACSMPLADVEELGRSCLLGLQWEFQNQVSRVVPRFRPEEYGTYAVAWRTLEAEIVANTPQFPSTTTADDRIKSHAGRVRKETLELMQQLRGARNAMLHDDVRRFSPDAFASHVEGCVVLLQRELQEATEVRDRVAEIWRAIPRLLLHVYYSVLLRRLRANEHQEFKIPAAWRPGRWVGLLLSEDAFKVLGKHVPVQFQDVFWAASAQRQRVASEPLAVSAQEWFAVVDGFLAAMKLFSWGADAIDPMQAPSRTFVAAA
jgi:hypothetical protein